MSSNQFQNHNILNYGNAPPQQPGGFHPSSPHGSFPSQSSNPPPSSPPPQKGMSKGKKIAIVVAVIIVCGAVITFLTNRPTSPSDGQRSGKDKPELVSTNDEPESNSHGAEKPAGKSDLPGSKGSPGSGGPPPGPDSNAKFDSLFKTVRNALWNDEKKKFVRLSDFFKAFAANPILVDEGDLDKLKAELRKDGKITGDSRVDPDLNFDFLYDFNYLKSKSDRNIKFTDDDVARLAKVDPLVVAYGIPCNFLEKPLGTVYKYTHNDPDYRKLTYEIFQKILKDGVTDFYAILDSHEKQILELYHLFPHMERDDFMNVRSPNFNKYEIDRFRNFISNARAAIIFNCMIEKLDDVATAPDSDRTFVENMTFDVTKYRRFSAAQIAKFTDSEKDFSQLPLIQKASPDVIEYICCTYKYIIDSPNFICSILSERDAGFVPENRHKEFGRLPLYVVEAVKEKLREEGNTFAENSLALYNMEFLKMVAIINELGSEEKFPDYFPKMFYKYYPLLYCSTNDFSNKFLKIRVKILKNLLEELAKEENKIPVKTLIDNLLSCDSLVTFYKANYNDLVPWIYCINKLNTILNLPDEKFDVFKKFLNLVWELELVKALHRIAGTINIPLNSKNEKFLKDIQFNPGPFLTDLEEWGAKFNGRPNLADLASLKSYKLVDRLK
jgi:hypothetical protein